MPHMRTCCCCANVRSGSFLVVAWSLLYSSAHIFYVLDHNIARLEQMPSGNVYDNFTINSKDVINSKDIIKSKDIINRKDIINNRDNINNRDITNINNNVNTRKINSVINPPGFYQSELQEIHLIQLLIFSAVSICCLLLLVGLCKDIPSLLVPWLTMTTVATITELLCNLYLLLQKTKTFEPKTVTIFTYAFFLFLLQWYTVLCVYSQYSEYKAGRGHSKDNACSFAIPGVDFEPPGKSSPGTPAPETSRGGPEDKVSLTKEQENPGKLQGKRVLPQIMEEETSFLDNKRSDSGIVENNFVGHNDENINEDNPSSDQSVSPVSPLTTSTNIENNKDPSEIDNSENEDNHDDSCDERFQYSFSSSHFQSPETAEKREPAKKVQFPQFPADIKLNVKVTSV